MIERVAERLVSAIYYTSPYRWLDLIFERSGIESNKKQRYRYMISEIYILGWLGMSVIFLLISQWLSILFVYFLMPRVIEIFNKELCVVLFKKCKITQGERVSNYARVIILAFANYLTAGLLFALLYTKVGTYQLDTAASPLPLKHAAMESLSILFTLSPAYDPLDFQTRAITMAEAGFCFIFGILVISTFIGLIRLDSDTRKG